MPTYEYACRDCGEHLEVVQSFKDEPLIECPHCHGQLRKVFSPIGIAFKGSGFYKNDSRSGSSSGIKDGSGGDTAAASSTPSDTKPGSDTKSGDTKSGDTKSGDTKSGDTKSGDTKKSDAKSGGSSGKPGKPSGAPAKAAAS